MAVTGLAGLAGPTGGTTGLARPAVTVAGLAGPARIAPGLAGRRELVLDPRAHEVHARQESGAVDAAGIDGDEGVRAREEVGAADVADLDAVGGRVVVGELARGGGGREGRAQVQGGAR